MKKLLCKTRFLCLPITLLIIQLGCAQHLPPISKEVTENLGKLGTIGVFTLWLHKKWTISKENTCGAP